MRWIAEALGVQPGLATSSTYPPLGRLERLLSIGTRCVSAMTHVRHGWTDGRTFNLLPCRGDAYSPAVRVCTFRPCAREVVAHIDHLDLPKLSSSPPPDDLGSSTVCPKGRPIYRRADVIELHARLQSRLLQEFLHKVRPVHRLHHGLLELTLLH